ncbi:MAG: hypothetical protein MJ217_01245 [Bacilli bacterium]|nr:hypothetical protein [Bacilli bacterium]
MNKSNKKFLLNPYILVILSFVIVILIGSFLLVMPWANKWGAWLWDYDCYDLETGTTFIQHLTYWDSLLTAVSATCVTGVSTYALGVCDSLTFGGQLVTIILIQIGGLGFITILTFIVTIFKSRLEFRNRYLISQMVNSTNFADVVVFVRKIVIISLIIEGVGTLLYLPPFLKMYPGDFGLAIWNSIYHSISSFNNAGFDLFHGVTSLIRDASVPDQLGLLSMGEYIYFCSIAAILVVSGGISFMVITDIFNFKKKPKQWRAFTKVVLLTTTILIIIGTLLLWLTDGLKGSDSMSLLDCLFESISSRTAGFFVYPQDHISTAGKIIISLLMIIGGSPLSTAGGIKTTTIFMIVLAMLSYFRSKKLCAFNRSYSSNLVVKAMSLFLLSLTVIAIAFIVVLTFETNAHLDLKTITYFDETNGMHSTLSELVLFEICSCFGTVGFFNGIEPYLTIGSKIVLCLLMFLGRLGPFTFFQVFQKNMDKEEKLHYQYIEEDFLIG